MKIKKTKHVTGTPSHWFKYQFDYEIGLRFNEGVAPHNFVWPKLTFLQVSAYTGVVEFHCSKIKFRLHGPIFVLPSLVSRLGEPITS